MWNTHGSHIPYSLILPSRLHHFFQHCPASFWPGCQTALPCHGTTFPFSLILNEKRFSFYQRWFDWVFLLSGCVTAVTLLAFHLANRNSDADHHDDHHHHTVAERSVGVELLDMEAFLAGSGEETRVPCVHVSSLTSSTDLAFRPRSRVPSSADPHHIYFSPEQGRESSNAWKAGNLTINSSSSRWSSMKQSWPMCEQG